MIEFLVRCVLLLVFFGLAVRLMALIASAALDVLALSIVVALLCGIWRALLWR